MYFIYTWVGLLQAPQFNLLHTTVIQSDPHSVTVLVSVPLTVFPCLSELPFQYDLSHCTYGNAWKNYKLCTFFCLIQTGFVKNVHPWLFILVPKVFGRQGFVLGSPILAMVMLLLLFNESCKESLRQPLELFMCLSLICYCIDKYWVVSSSHKSLDCL